MRRAQKRDAVNKEKFYFRMSLVPEDEEEESKAESNDDVTKPTSHDHEYTLMSIDTIINGKASRAASRASSSLYHNEDVGRLKFV